MFAPLKAPTLYEAYCNKKVAFQSWANIWNDNLKINWLNYFYSTFLVELMNANIPASSQPTPPPASWVLVEAQNGSKNNEELMPQDLDGMGLQQIGGPVCAVPSFHPPVFLQSSGWFRLS